MFLRGSSSKVKFSLNGLIVGFIALNFHPIEFFCSNRLTLFAQCHDIFEGARLFFNIALNSFRNFLLNSAAKFKPSQYLFAIYSKFQLRWLSGRPGSLSHGFDSFCSNLIFFCRVCCFEVGAQFAAKDATFLMINTRCIFNFSKIVFDRFHRIVFVCLHKYINI